MAKLTLRIWYVPTLYSLFLSESFVNFAIGQVCMYK